MRVINLLHLGIGKVGKALVRQIIENKDRLKDEYNLNLNYCGIFISKGGIFDKEGLTDDRLISFAQNSNTQIEVALHEIKRPFILIDTTASDETYPYLILALKNGGGVVLSNKKPLSSSQNKFDKLHQLSHGRLFYETTVGAALPVVSTLKSLLETGDKIIEIKGCFSGTLGYLFSCLEEGNKFSETVLAAKQKGYTEPDPRDDLSGVDVARKALILARVIGRKLELSDIRLDGLYPDGMNKLTIEEFLKAAVQLDSLYQDRFQQAKQSGRTLRYLANITPKICQVGIEAVDKNSDLGSLKGPDNIIIFKTRRYFDNPLVVKGPGAGVEVTASGVFADILTVADMI